MAGKYCIHESEVEFKPLPGRAHKMILGPDNFGPCRNMCFGVADFPPQAQAPAHVHKGEEEIIYILSGEGEIYFEGEPEEVRPGTCVYIPPGIRHSINNPGKEIIKLVYVFSPPVVQGSYEEKK